MCALTKRQSDFGQYYLVESAQAWRELQPILHSGILQVVCDKPGKVSFDVYVLDPRPDLFLARMFVSVLLNASHVIYVNKSVAPALPSYISHSGWWERDSNKCHLSDHDIAQGIWSFEWNRSTYRLAFIPF